MVEKRNVCGGSVGGQSESGNCKREEAEAWLVCVCVCVCVRAHVYTQMRVASQ